MEAAGSDSRTALIMAEAGEQRDSRWL